MEKITSRLLDNPIPFESEIWLFKVPKNFPIEKLTSLEIPKSKSTESTITHKNQEYIVKPIQDDLGELKNVEFIGPSPQGYKTGYEFKRVYAIQPHVDITTEKELKEIGERNRDVEYVPREQPEGMKLQSLPAGFTTDGKTLKKILKRYRSLSPKKSPKKSKKK